MIGTAEISKAATVLGLSEEVITRFLYLVNSLEKHIPEKSVAPYYNTAALESLVDEYVEKL